MKRLIVCCDGTWKGAADLYPSNVEQIARAVLPRSADGVSQIVHYVSGVGTGETRVDRLLGGALGLGLNSGLMSGYRFLALNYEPGDQIFLFGFSRGAYTARSLAGMLTFNGLLTLDGVLNPSNPLCYALDVYRGRPRDGGPVDTRTRQFRKLTFQDADRPWINFLGVFDTVGSLGIPGRRGKGFEFLDVDLSPDVLRARHALAIDEPRLKFAPAVWNGNARTDLKQVWFDGDHTDIGGGHADTTLSDETLRWMVREASSDEIGGGGIDFKFRQAQPPRCRRPRPFNPMKPAWWLDNRLTCATRWIRRSRLPIRTEGQHRIIALSSDDVQNNGIFIAESAYRNWVGNATRVAAAPNIGWWLDAEGYREEIPVPIEPDIRLGRQVARAARVNGANYVRAGKPSGPRIGQRAHAPYVTGSRSGGQ